MELNPHEIFLLLFASIGPLKAAMVCPSLTVGKTDTECNRVALRSVTIATIICLIFAIFGGMILRVFKVSIPAFQIGGGIVVLLFAIEMVRGTDKSKDKEREKSKGQTSPGAGQAGTEEISADEDIAVYPLAIPLMASVSGLVAIVSAQARRNDLRTLIYLVGVILVIMSLNYVCLRCSRSIVGWLGPLTLQVVNRLLGVLLCGLAIELMLIGLVDLGVVTRPPVKTTASSLHVPSSACPLPGGHPHRSERSHISSPLA